MGIAQSAVFLGGRHDGEQSQPLEHKPFPETLFCITWDDGERYARTDEHVMDALTAGNASCFVMTPTVH